MQMLKNRKKLKIETQSTFEKWEKVHKYFRFHPIFIFKKPKNRAQKTLSMKKKFDRKIFQIKLDGAAQTYTHISTVTLPYSFRRQI